MTCYPKVVSVQPIDNYQLIIKFSNHQYRRYDVKALLKKEMFAPLENLAFFKNVQIESGGYAVSWNEDIDISEYELWKNGIELKKEPTLQITAMNPLEFVSSEELQ
jgi:hypothetical protein